MTKHAILSASGSERWLNCPASIKLSEGIKGESSVYAKEGTAAHSLAERCFAESSGPRQYEAQEIFVEGSTFSVDDEMIDAVEQYLEVCRSVTAVSDIIEIEKQVNLNNLWHGGKAPSDMFGTADYTSYSKRRKKVTIIDYKHGKGVPVDVIGNTQLMYYALGSIMAAPGPVSWVEIIVVQPRASHVNGPVRRVTLTGIDLVEWGYAVLKPGAEACFEPDPKIQTGKWCRWCPAAFKCPALRAEVLKTAQMEFGGDQLPPDPKELDPKELAHVLSQGELISAFLSACKQDASDRIDHGVKIPGWKKVAKRATRKWANETAAVEVFSGMMESEKVGDLFTHELKSPAQVEKMVRDKALFKQFEEDGVIQKKSSGETLVPDFDPRIAVRSGSAADDFEDYIPD